MNKKDKTVLIEKLKRLSADIDEIVSDLEGHAEGEAPTVPESPETPVKVYTLEEVRKILAEKARGGYRAEVKAILSAHGAKQLSDVTDPAELAVIVAEAEVIGSA